MQVSQTDLIIVMLAAVDRLAPGLLINPVAMNALIAAADALIAANQEPVKPLPVLSEEAQLVALDRVPGWEAA
jgi:hypothetical protein